MSLGLDELTTRAYDLVAAGELAPARAALEEGLAETGTDGDSVSPDLAEAASLYARVLLACGEPQAARDWARYAHGAAERLHGTDDERTVRDAATLAAALYRVGDLADAERLYRDVVDRLTAQEGSGSPHALAARADLATVLHATGQCRAARSELAGALAAHQAGYGLHEPAGIRMLARLAAMSRDCGDEAAAQRHFTRAGALAEAYLPGDHPVAAQVAALAAAPANGAHPCQLTTADPAGAAEGGPDWWPPEQQADEVGSATDGPEPGPGSDPQGGPGPNEARPVPNGAGPAPDATGAGTGGADGAPGDADSGWSGAGPEPDQRVRTIAGRVSRGHLAAPRRLPPTGQVHLPPTPGDAPANPPSAPPPYPADYPEQEYDEVDYPATALAQPGPASVQPGPASVQPHPGSVQPHPGSVQPHPYHAPGGDSFGAGAPNRYAGTPVASGSTAIERVRPYQDRYLPATTGPSRSRWTGVAIGTALAVLGLAIGWFAATTIMDDDDSAGRSPVAGEVSPTAGSPAPAAPSQVSLRDGRDSVTLTWTYPKGAEGPVIVAGGRAGEQQRAFHTLGAGSTSYTVYSLVQGDDYCFTVAVVYSTDTVARSEPVCTARKNSSRAPG